MLMELELPKKRFIDWLKKQSPDVICLQETKAQKINWM